MKYKRTQKRSKQMWQRVEKFSIRKFSFGAASCLIGASLVGVAINPNIVDAAFKQLNGEDGIVSLYSNSGETPESADGIEIGSKVNVDNEIGIDVDWSEYTRENPIVKVTYTYNGGADGERVAGFGGHRPRFWFTTPIGLKEPKEITLKKNDGRPVYVMESWNRNKKFGSLSNSINSRFQTEDDINRAYTTPDFHGNDTKWESYNETTGEPYREWSGSFADKFWYHIGDRVSDNASEQALFEKFRTDTKTIYVDWERGGIERATITAVYEVADPTFGNDRRTLEFGAGFRVGIARMMQHYKTVLAPVPSLYKLNEIFEPDVPSRIAVTNPKSLTTEEKNTIKAKILEANKDNVTTVHRTAKNKLVENLFSDEETSIEIGADGKATIRYADNTIDEIPGTSLVYERPQIDNNETTQSQFGDYKYLTNPFEVDDINNLKDTDVESAKLKFYTVNNMTVEKNEFDEDVIKAVGEPLKTSPEFVNKRLEIDKRTGLGYIYSGSGPTGATIPKAHLFKQKPKKTFNIDEARQDAEKAIDNLTYLSPKEKQNFKTELASKTTQDDLNAVVNNAIAKNSSNEKALEAKKRDAKEAINNNPYLTNAQKKELTDKVSAVVMTDPTEGTATPIEHTKGLIDKILDEALEKTKEKAKAIIDEIDKKDGKAGYLTDPTADAYKERIKKAPSQAEITKIIGEAQSQVSKKAHDAEKAKTDALKDEYKKKIDQVPGLTDAQKDEYKKQIDAATTRDQLEAIVKDAEVKAYRDTAKAKIDALEHLNAAQKAELKTQVDAAGSKAEVDNIVSIAQGLDSKMDSLQKLVEKAKEVKGSEKYNTAAQDKKDAFDTANAAASKVADKTTTEPENAAGTSEVATLIDNLAKAIEALTGEKVAVPVSKDALKAEIDLNTDDAVKKSPAYAKETDAAKKKAYDDALANAQKVYDKQDATQTDVDNALDTLKQARLALSGKAEDFTLAVKDGAAKISVVPKAGDSLAEKDQPTVKAKLTANGKELDDTYTVKYGEIAEKGGKTVVPVTVTHDGITRTVEVPVEGTDAAKSPLNLPTKVKVDNPNGLTEKEKIAVKDAVKKTNPTLKDEDISVDEKGNVTVTYPDTSTNKLEADKTVEAKTEEEKALEKAKNDAKDKLKEAAEKEIAEIKGDNTLSDDDKKTKLGKVQSEKAKAEKAVEGATTPATVKDETNKGVEAIEKVHTDINKVKEKAKEELEKAAEKEKEDIKADNSLSDSDKKELNDKVDKAKNDAISKINTATTVKGIEDAKQKGEQAIKAVHQSDLDKKKAEAKKELETAAEAEKKEIESDLTLDPDTKVQKKKEVDKVKEKAEKAVEDADTSDEVTNATDEGKKDIADVHTVDINKVKEKAIANLTEAAKEEEKEIDADNGLTESEKTALKNKVNAVKIEHEGNIGKATTAEDIAKATTAGKQAIAGVHTSTDIKDKSKKLKAPQEKVKVKDINQLTDPEKEDVKEAVKKANQNLGLSNTDITVDGKGNVTTPKGYLLPKDVIVPALNKPTTPVTVKDPNQLTPEEKAEVKKAVSEANKDSNLNPADVHVDDKGNVTTDNNGNLPAGDVVTQKLKKPAKPVEVVNPKKLTDPEKEKVKTAIVEANKDANGNPTVAREQVTVHDDGSVTTPIGNLNSEDVVKAKTETTPQGDNTDPAVTLKGEDLVFDLPELSVQNTLVAGVVTVEKGQPLTDEDIKKQLVLTEDMVVNSIKKPSTTETGNKEAEVEITLADGSKVTVKVPVVVVESLENANTGNNLAEAKEEAKKRVEEAANNKIEGINNRTDLSDPEKKAATDKVNKAKDDANAQIDNATSSGTAKAIGDAAAENIQNFNPEANNPAGDIDQVDTSKLDEEKAKAIAEIEQAVKDQINAINNNKGLTSSQKAEAIKKIEELKVKAIEDVRKADSVDKVKDIVNKVVGEIKAVNPQPYSGYSYGDGIHSSSDAQANSEALANAKESAKNVIEKAAKDKQDEIKDASLSDKEQAELLARVEAEKQAALKAIENAKTVEDVKEAETIGLQAIASVTVPKKPVAPNAAAPQETSAPQATAGTMQDVTYQSPAGKQLPNTGSASSAALASLGLVAATSGFALLGRKTRRRK